MATWLRDLKKTRKGLGGKGKLTAKLSDQLAIYYGLEICRNSDSVEKMKNEIWVTLFHMLSTNQNPQHDKCSEAWCDWKKAQAAGALRRIIKPLLGRIYSK